jgi:hypothetical protein
LRDAAMPNCFARTIERRRPILPRLSQGIFVAGFLLNATVSSRADDTNLVNEVKQLREQNAQLQQQLKQQGEQINALSRQFKDLQAAQPAGDGGEKPEAHTSSALNKVIIGGEGGAGYALTGPQGFAANGKFQLDDARLFLDAPVWNDVYFYGEVLLAYPGQTDNQLELGELYVDFENVSKLWNQDDQLSARAGQMYIPFGEEYLTCTAINNPLISESLLDFWGLNPGAELYGKLGKFSYVAAVQNGARDANGAGGDKSVAARIGFDPEEHWHFSVSGMRTGDLNAGQLSAMWFAGGFFRSVGSAATTRFHVNAVEADSTARWKSGHVKVFGGVARYDDNDPTADNGRNIYYYSAEVLQNLPKNFYAVTRWSQAYCNDGVPMVGFGNFGNYFFGPLTENLWRWSLGLGYKFSERLVLKAEYSLERGYLTGGTKRNQEDFFGTEAAFGF